MRNNLFWDENNTPSELHAFLEAVSGEFPVSRGKEKINLAFEKCGEENFLSVTDRNGVFLVRYGSRHLAARGVGFALAGKECRETWFFKTFAVLVDCTRSAVMNVPHFRKWLLRLALMGYNMAMLYTKDAYQVPGEPYFGYMRGPYSLEEMREVDAFAKSVGVEMIASIQALGHLEPILRWPAFAEVRDTESCVMVDKKETYDLLEKMIRFWSEAFSSRRIHLGMDETEDLGRGRFLTLNGYEPPYQLYNRHLKKLCAICDKFDLKPIIWSDMYFKYANKSMDYYGKKDEIPSDITKDIPQNVQLSYWDYYHRDKQVYIDKLSLQKKFNGTLPVMASGIWTWARLWCDHEQTRASAGACMDGCRETGVNEIIFTMWGDDGNYCEFDSAFASMVWCAEYGACGKADEEKVKALYEALCSSSYAVQIRAGDLEWTIPHPKGKTPGEVLKFHAGPILWDDPLMGILWHEYKAVMPDYWDKAIAHYRKLLADLDKYIDEHPGEAEEDFCGGMVIHARMLADVLLKKMVLRRQLLASYAKRDFDTLNVLLQRNIPELLDALEGLQETFRKEWMRSYKSWGYEVVGIKVAGVAERVRETGRRIEELLDGTSERIEELEVSGGGGGYVWENRYRMIATGAWFI